MTSSSYQSYSNSGKELKMLIRGFWFDSTILLVSVTKEMICLQCGTMYFLLDISTIKRATPLLPNDPYPSVLPTTAWQEISRKTLRDQVVWRVVEERNQRRVGELMRTEASLGFYAKPTKHPREIPSCLAYQ